MVNFAAALSKTFGLLFNALCFNCIFLGVTFMQTLWYFQASPKDAWYVKMMVVAVTLCSLVQVSLLWSSVYHYSLFTQGNILAYLHLVPEMGVQIYFSGTVGFITQNFYAIRIIKLSKSTNVAYIRVLAALVSLSSFVSLVAMFWATSRVLIKYTNWLQLTTENTTGPPVMKTLFIVHNAFGAVADTGASMILIFLLHRSKNGFKPTSRILNRLIFQAINTGLPTTVTSIVCAALIQSTSPTVIFVYLFIYLLQVHIYANSMLFTLNTRAYIRSRSEFSSGIGTDEFIMSIPREPSRRSKAINNQFNAPNISILMETVDESFSDNTKASGRETLDSKSHERV